jgi:16S rRNA U1498 N3-methylase RsmE
VPLVLTVKTSDGKSIAYIVNSLRLKSGKTVARRHTSSAFYRELQNAAVKVLVVKLDLREYILETCRIYFCPSGRFIDQIH